MAFTIHQASREPFSHLFKASCKIKSSPKAPMTVGCAATESVFPFANRRQLYIGVGRRSIRLQWENLSQGKLHRCRSVCAIVRRTMAVLRVASAAMMAVQRKCISFHRKWEISHSINLSRAHWAGKLGGGDKFSSVSKVVNGNPFFG